MKAVRALGHGGPEAAAWVDVDDPVAKDGETLIDVHAAGCNRADLLQVAGMYPPPKGASETLGLEAAGIDRETGRRVCFLLAGGGMAERVAVDRRLLMPVPDNLSFEQAAALPEAWLTAYTNLIDSGRLAAGEWVLVHAAASGVGTAAVQLAKYKGARVIGTVRSAQKAEQVAALGAESVIVTGTNEPALRDRVMALTADYGVDVILDVLGGGTALKENLSLLAEKGRLVVIALMAGAQAELDLRALMTKRLSIAGTTLRARPLEDKCQLVAAFSREVLPAFATGALKPVVDSVLSVEQVADALTRMQSNANVGKIVLKIRS